MRLLLFFAVTMLSLIPAAMSGAEKKKLQIGIKKRVDNCPIKSRKGDVLNMHYTGKLEDGTEFDSSIPRDRPFTFTLGTGQVIKGWDQGLLGMCEGEKGSWSSPPSWAMETEELPRRSPEERRSSSRWSCSASRGNPSFDEQEMRELSKRSRSCCSITWRLSDL
ncbi:hypothetical protein F7725_027968 [Dissostichus mawsoni]|uniref:peptidylprolyl isomerase n=1 Tax=Dissostichus mawsoni TaxID=36200 RepID=A0A7J5XEP6_DISMA|nr:hypothetical protein F7725_027968 [Dissostichus mawsoni]